MRRFLGVAARWGDAPFRLRRRSRCVVAAAVEPHYGSAMAAEGGRR